eukprot:jgi/Botrbrau1/22139/Bobra.0206s0063.1
MKSAYEGHPVILFVILIPLFRLGTGNNAALLEHWENFQGTSFPVDYASLGMPSLIAYLPTISSFNQCSDLDNIQCAFCAYNGAAANYVNRFTGFVALTTATYRFQYTCNDFCSLTLGSTNVLSSSGCQVNHTKVTGYYSVTGRTYAFRFEQVQCGANATVSLKLSSFIRFICASASP